MRDGLKPVQRRILYTMWQQNLTADAKHRKCAKVVGDVMGNYHPHGDSAIYETLVRMAQSFSLRFPLVDGSGNFGSLDGDGAAAMRYTECRLARVADEVLQEIEQETVAVPARATTAPRPSRSCCRRACPNLLVNGATGIAVGMATNIPPHNLSEVCTALIKLLDNQELTTLQLCRCIKGPDFPTGGHILNSPDELKEIYKTGSGSIRLRATWETGPSSRSGKKLYITSIPYAVNKAQLVEQIGDVVLSRKMPHLVDVRDLSTDDVRIELELKAGADENLVMAYLFKNTSLQTTFAVNMTCLVPTENAEVGRPERLDLKQMLWYFLHFRLEVVTSRLEHELEQLQRRIHILEGFEKVFDALDEIIRIIRKSDGKADAAEKIMKRFALDAEQTDAILELKLYRLARLEILVIQKRAGREAQARAADRDAAQGRRGPLEAGARGARGDPEEVRQPEDRSAPLAHRGNRRSRILRRRLHRRRRQRRHRVARRLGEAAEGSEGPVDDAPARRRQRAGGGRRQHPRDDGVLQQLRRRLHRRIVDVPASTGYGEPMQKLFKLKDGEKVVAAFSLDPRVAKKIEAKKEGDVPPVHAIAITSDGYALRFSLEPFVEASTRSGRRYARTADGAEVVSVGITTGEETVIAATAERARDADARRTR